MSDSNGYPDEWKEVSLQTKIDAGFRCVRCGHPSAMWLPAENDPHIYARVAFASRNIDAAPRIYVVEGGAWIRFPRLECDVLCSHRVRWSKLDIANGRTIGPKSKSRDDRKTDPRRVMTVHHLDGVKANLAWWNLVCLCQRCHLTIQGRVKMDQAYLHPHSDWFCVYVAGFYAKTVLGLDLTRDEVESDMARFLSAGQPHLDAHYRTSIRQLEVSR